MMWRGPEDVARWLWGRWKELRVTPQVSYPTLLKVVRKTWDALKARNFDAESHGIWDLMTQWGELTERDLVGKIEEVLGLSLEEAPPEVEERGFPAKEAVRSWLMLSLAPRFGLPPGELGKLADGWDETAGWDANVGWLKEEILRRFGVPPEAYSVPEPDSPEMMKYIGAEIAKESEEVEQMRREVERLRSRERELRELLRAEKIAKEEAETERIRLRTELMGLADRVKEREALISRIFEGLSGDYLDSLRAKFRELGGSYEGFIGFVRKHAGELRKMPPLEEAEKLMREYLKPPEPPRPPLFQKGEKVAVIPEGRVGTVVDVEWNMLVGQYQYRVLIGKLVARFDEKDLRSTRPPVGRCPVCGGELARLTLFPLPEEVVKERAKGWAEMTEAERRTLEETGRRPVVTETVRTTRVVPVPPEMALFYCPKCRLIFRLREGRMVQIGYDEARRMVERTLPRPAPAPRAPAYAGAPAVVFGGTRLMPVGKGAGRLHPAIRCRPAMTDEEISRILEEEYGLTVPPAGVRHLRRMWWGT